ncbi:O-antigen ligase [Pseudoalteromonas sp. Angola-31]|nr:O-antigen ligase [Pseudoalteromonas sp. Angola-31]
MHDSKNLRVLSPLKLLSAGLLFFLAIMALAPVTIKVTFSREVFLYIASSYLMFCAGCLFVKYIPKKTNRLRIPKALDERFALNLSLYFALFGVFFRLIDRIYIRGVAIGQSAFENREMLANTESGIVSIISAILFPLVFTTLFLHLKNYKVIGKLRLFIVIALFFYPSFDALLFGSRSLILINFSILIIILYSLKIVNFRFTTIVVIMAGILMLLSLSGFVFLNRLDEMGLDILDSVYYSGYAKMIGPSDNVVHLLSGEMTLLKTFVFSWLNFCQYYLHGLFEFSEFISQKINTHSYGAVQFNVIFKFFSVFGLLPAPEGLINEVTYRAGIFTTFLGPAHMDFGYFSVFYMFFFGAFSTGVYNQIVISASWYSVFYFMLCIIIFFMPVVNFIQSAQGVYILLSVVFFDVMYKACCFVRK